MRSVILFAFILLGFVLANASESDVKVLTVQNFDTETAQGEWLLEFYAPWCGHCKSLAPKYEELATKVKGKFNIAKIDCTIEQPLQTRFSIGGFPTIKFLKDGKLYQYSGQRTVDAFVEFLEGGYSSVTPTDVPKTAAPAAEKKAAPSDVVTLTEANFDTHTNTDTWFLEFYAPWCGHCKRLAPVYEEVATALKGKVKVGKVNCDEEKTVCSQYAISGYPTILYKKDGSLREYNGGRTLDAFKSFALEGGWEKAESKAAPEPVAAWKKSLMSVLTSVESTVGDNLWLVIGVCVVIGIALGVLVVSCAAPAAAPKTVRYTPAPGASTSDKAEDDEVSNKQD